MEPIFIYFNVLKSNNEKKITLRFSQEKQTKKKLPILKSILTKKTIILSLAIHVL